MSKEIIATTNAPGAVGPYVQAVKCGGMVYCSGQLGIDVSVGKLAPTLEDQAHCSMKNMGAILSEAGSGYDKIVKIGYLLAGAFARRMTEVSAFAGIHRRDEHKVAGEGKLCRCASDGYLSVLDRLTERFDNVCRKFGELVKEENTVVCK